MPKEVPCVVPELQQRDRTTTAHRKAVQLEIKDLARVLGDVLTRKLVAYMLGDVDPKTVGRWASGERKPRSRETEETLRGIFQIFQMLHEEDSPHTVRAWFIGLNPQLEDESPAAAIRDGRIKDVIIAAKAYLAGG